VIWSHHGLFLIGAGTMKFFQDSGNCRLSKILKTVALPSISLVVLLLTTILIIPSVASAEIEKEFYPSGNP
jgi:uncharacterized membrane protein YdcZ (DUF606 family)|tara:strand:- start:86 stop:298 length:213 start_codon:yes stop_codon:yes gene_type:complete